MRFPYNHTICEINVTQYHFLLLIATCNLTVIFTLILEISVVGNWCGNIGLYVRQIPKDMGLVKERSEIIGGFVRRKSQKIILPSSHIYLQIENINLEELPAPTQADRNV